MEAIPLECGALVSCALSMHMYSVAVYTVYMYMYNYSTATYMCMELYGDTTCVQSTRVERI